MTLLKVAGIVLAACLLIVFVASHVTAQTPTSSGYIEKRMQFVPATDTDVFTANTQIIKIMLSNTSASAVTCTVKNKGTGCGGAACQFWPAISLPANAIQAIDMGGILSLGGVQWSCSTANVVVGSILGRQ